MKWLIVFVIVALATQSFAYQDLQYQEYQKNQDYQDHQYQKNQDYQDHQEYQENQKNQEDQEYQDTTVINLEPRQYCILQMTDLDKISINAYDIGNNLVTVYLNSGIVDYFDPRNSLINCNDVAVCNVKEMGLVSGSYTLFVFNDYYMFEQSISLTLSIEFEAERHAYYVVLFILISIFVAFCVCMAFCLKKFWKVPTQHTQVTSIEMA